MAEATFQPGAPVGYVSDNAYKGVEEGQSMMMRASQLRQSQQMEQMRQQQITEHQALLPVKIAQAQADITTAHAAVTNAARMQVFRTQAASAAPAANDEFLSALQLADWDAQSAEMSRIQAKYSFMGQLPEYQGFLKTVDEARANAVIRAKTDQTLEAEQERTSTMANARMDASGATLEGRKYVADVGAQARAQVADTNAGARVQSAQIGAGAKQAATASSMERTQYRGLIQSAIESDKEALKLATNGDEHAAEVARGRAQAFRDSAKMIASPPAPDKFNVPNTGSASAATEETAEPAGREEPDNTPTAEAALYEERDGRPSFTAAVKTPEDTLKAIQQMVDDGKISVDEARATLLKLGFKKKGS